MRINLLWPRWAQLVAPLKVYEIRRRGDRCWQTVKRAAVLLADLADYQQIARLRRKFPAGRASVRPEIGMRWLMLLVLFLGALALPSSAAARAPDPWLVALEGAGAADFATTELWLHHPYARELNPLGQHRAARVALKVGSNALVWWAARKLDHDGHERAADLLRWCALSAQLSASGWNVSLTVRR